MAKQQNFIGLPNETLIDVVAIKKTENNIESITVAEMTLQSWHKLKRKPEFTYIAYQKDYHSYKSTKTK